MFVLGITASHSIGSVLIGRGSVVARDNTISTLSLTALSEFLFEGGDGDTIGTVGYDEIRGAAVTAPTPLGVISHGGEQFSHHSSTSIGFNNVNANYVSIDVAIPTNYGYEFWYRDSISSVPPGNQAVLIGQNNNNSFGLGYPDVGQFVSTVVGDSGFDFPTSQNDTINTQYFVPMGNLNLASDGLVHHFFEFHDTGVINNFTTCIDGMPVYSGTNGGIAVINKLLSFNGQPAEVAANRAGAEFGSFVAWNNGSNLTLKDVRDIFETSALGKFADMLTSPLWFELDGENVTVESLSNLQATLGDITDTTGVRSGAIPRQTNQDGVLRKTYFEIEIIGQGDTTTATLFGIRKFAETGTVGSTSQLSTDAYYVNAGKLYDGSNTILPTGAGSGNQDASTLASPVTGQIYRVAIDWTTGDWWIGDDTQWKGTAAGVADPATGTAPLDGIDTTYNWGAWLRTNGINGNGVVRLRGMEHSFRLTPPAGFEPWEAGPTLEITPYGVERRQGVLDDLGVLRGRTYLFEGGASSYLLETNPRGDRGTLLDGAGTNPTHAGVQLSYASVDSIQYPRTANAYSQEPTNPKKDVLAHAFEFWFRQPDFTQVGGCTLFGRDINSQDGIGTGDGAHNLPTYRNNFNNDVRWESEIDVYGDDLPHQLIEAHTTPNGSTYTVYLDGMPVAEGDGGDSGWLDGVNRIRFNHSQANGDTARSGGHFGSYIEFRGNRSLTMFDVRKLYEASALAGNDMLTNPRWFIRDSINCTVSVAPAKDLTCGDVTDNTGGRSGAIPRNGKVYFEVQIVSQGDTTSANLLGLRKLAEPSNVGFDPDTATDEYHTNGTGGVEDGQDTSLGITGTLGTAATGRIFQFAIDWATGDWWMGTDNTLWAGVGGTGNPSTGANPLDALDVDFNWACSNRVNGINGAGVVRLITAAADLNYAVPTAYSAWEDAI